MRSQLVFYAAVIAIVLSGIQADCPEVIHSMTRINVASDHGYVFVCCLSLRPMQETRLYVAKKKDNFNLLLHGASTFSYTLGCVQVHVFWKLFKY